MKAIVQTGFGPPEDVLEVRDVDRPVVEDGGVLVAVRAASIHIGDAHMARGVPYVMRPLFRAMRARNGVTGSDVAGVVEEVGTNLVGLEPGDEVFGWCKGAFAEYACASEDSLVVKPAALAFEEAAAVGTSAFAALQALRDWGRLRSGQSVLIVGASGGVGTFAVQIAKAFGAEVTGVCSTRNLDMVRALGADHVIDYTKENWTTGAGRYDLILDNVGDHPLRIARRPLTTSGKLLPNGSPVHGMFGGLGRIAAAALLSPFVKGQGRPFVSAPTRDDLKALAELVESGSTKPVIDRTYALVDAPQAVAHVARGHARGKTVLTL